MVNANDIKVHVNAAQRELLALLVNRRLHDVQRHTWGNARPADGELELLRELKYELEQAGT